MQLGCVRRLGAPAIVCAGVVAMGLGGCGQSDRDRHFMARAHVVRPSPGNGMALANGADPDDGRQLASTGPHRP